MSHLHNYSFFCLSSNFTYQEKRFSDFDIKCSYYDIKYASNINNSLDEFNGFGHLCMIYDFYFKSENEYGVFCENEIYIHKDIQTLLPKILFDFKLLNLDILLLAYLTPFIVDEFILENVFSLKRERNVNTKYSYHNYPDNLIGTKMYILSRKHAKYLIDKYYEGYITNTFIDNTGESFTSSDLLITRAGNKALISPSVACITAETMNDFHIQCKNTHYNKSEFI
jgi:hypothetical protein